MVTIKNELNTVTKAASNKLPTLGKGIDFASFLTVMTKKLDLEKEFEATFAVRNVDLQK